MTEIKQDIPNPGSDEAIAQNCLCPINDNHKGTGAYGKDGVFWMNIECPLHGDPNYGKGLEE